MARLVGRSVLSRVAGIEQFQPSGCFEPRLTNAARNACMSAARQKAGFRLAPKQFYY